MSRAILPNYGFEYELAQRSLPAPARALERRYAHLLRLVPGWRDAPLFDTEPVDELLPWGWSERAAVASRRTEMGTDIVRKVNDKCFSHGVERELGIAPVGACMVHDVRDVASAAERLGAAWILKHPFGVAGRDQVRGPSDRCFDRVEKLFETTRAAVFEPLLAPTREFSTHYDCRPDGSDFVGVTRLLTDRSGTFRGNAIGLDLAPSTRAITDRVATIVAEQGYRGPLGIDGFVTTEGVRAVGEINARWTFGRLTIELARHLDSELTWHHGPASARPEGLVAAHPEPGAGCWLLPEWCDPAGVSGTWIEVADRSSEIDGSRRVC